MAGFYTALIGTSPTIQWPGLSPPCTALDGAEIRRHVFERPFGRDMLRFAQLREQRMIYRLALGQPNQEDFIDVLSRGGEATRALLQPLVLDFSAMGLRQQRMTGDRTLD
jgi:hypothetical protein